MQYNKVYTYDIKFYTKYICIYTNNNEKTLTTSIIAPHFRYAAQFWGGGKTETDRLQKLKYRAVRNVINSNYDVPK